MARVLNPYDVVSSARREQRIMDRRNDEQLNYGRNLAGSMVREWTSPRTILPVASAGASALMDRAARSKRLAALGMTADQATKRRMELLGQAFTQDDAAEQTRTRQEMARLGYALDTPGRSLSDHIGGRSAGLSGALAGDKMVRGLFPLTKEQQLAARAKALRERQLHEANLQGIRVKNRGGQLDNAAAEQTNLEAALSESDRLTKLKAESEQAQTLAKMKQMEFDIFKKDQKIRELKRRIKETDLGTQVGPEAEAWAQVERDIERQAKLRDDASKQRDYENKVTDQATRAEMNQAKLDEARSAADKNKAAAFKFRRAGMGKGKRPDTYRKTPIVDTIMKTGDQLTQRMMVASKASSFTDAVTRLRQVPSAQRDSAFVDEARRIIQALDPNVDITRFEAPEEYMQLLNSIWQKTSQDDLPSLQQAVRINTYARRLLNEMYDGSRQKKEVRLTVPVSVTGASGKSTTIAREVTVPFSRASRLLSLIVNIQEKVSRGELSPQKASGAFMAALASLAK